MIISEFIFLYFFNLLFDYPLQGNYLAEGKKNSLYLLWVHSAIWGFGLSIILMCFGIFSLWKLLFLVGGHFIIDYWKARELYKTVRCETVGCEDYIKITRRLSDEQALMIDQFLHLLQIIICLIL